jgi:hypothetical protein
MVMRVVVSPTGLIGTLSAAGLAVIAAAVLAMARFEVVVLERQLHTLRQRPVRSPEVLQ